MTARASLLLLPDGLSASGAADVLAAELAIVTQRASTIERTFWDTFDGRLRRAGLALAGGAGRLALLDAESLAEQAAAPLPAGAQRLFAGDLPEGPLRERVAPLLEMRALTPVARVRSRMLPISVLGDEGKIVVRLRAEQPAAVVPGSGRLDLRGRLHVAAVLGYDADYDAVMKLLSGRLGLEPATSPVHDDAIAAAGGDPAGTSSKPRIALKRGARADAAAVKILRRLLAIVELNTPGTLADVDTEFLHDLRVAVRRSRAMQRELAGVFPPAPLRAFRAGFKELQAITGPTRDLDVQLLEFDDLAAGLPDDVVGDVAPLRALLEDHLRAERAAMERALRSERTRALLDDWAAFLGELRGLPDADRPDAARPIEDLAGERIAKVYRSMVKHGAAIDDSSPADDLHELRKKGKELRYLLEFFAPLYEADVVKPMVATLKGLQDVLGRFQDREVQADRLRAFGDDVATIDGGAPALMAMGVLVQRLGDEQAQARGEFAARFAEFSAKRQRALVKRTFR